MRTQLVYSTGIGYFGKSLAAVTNNSFLFRGNGLFDPDVQVGGQQPMGFDQWAALYRHYRVIGSKITVTCGHQEQILIALNSMGAEAVSYTFDAQNATAMPGSKYSMAQTSQGPASANVILRSYQRSDSVTGLDKDEDTLSAQVTADPSAPWYWILTVCNASATTTFYHSFHVRIVYFVEFFHPQAVNMS